MNERLRPETAIALALYAHDTEPEPESYLARVVGELLEAESGVREHLTDLWFVELTEELSGRGEAEAVRVVLEVQAHWNQEA